MKKTKLYDMMQWWEVTLDSAVRKAFKRQQHLGEDLDVQKWQSKENNSLWREYQIKNTASAKFLGHK